MAVNSEGIYATRPWKVFGEGPASTDAGDGFVDKKAKPFTARDIRFTQSKDGHRLFAIVLGLPQQPVRIKALASAKVASVTLLGSETKLNWNQETDALVIQPLKQWPTPYAVTFKIALAK